MKRVFIAYDPNELESMNAYIIEISELGEGLPDLKVGVEIYEAELKYKITEEYKHLLSEAG